MNSRIILIFGAVLLTSCGGGSNDPSSAIEGTWRGDLIQGVISCSDGTGIGAGGGLAIREVALEISGTDEIGSSVQAIEGDCILEGERDVDGFNAAPVSGCNEALDSIRFTLLGEDDAALKLRYDINKVQPNEAGVRCTISPDARLQRE